MKIIFDPEKRHQILERRGLDFADAGAIFRSRHISQLDDRENDGEKRFITYEYIGDHIVVLLWTDRGASRRILSLRKANERRQKKVKKLWVDPDDALELTDDQFDRVAIWDGSKLVRPGDGTLTKPGRPKLKNPKQQVT